MFLPTFFRPITLSVVDKLGEAVILEQILPLVASVRDNFAFHAGISPAVGLLRALARTLLSSAPYVGVIIADISGGYENAILLDVLRALKARGASRQILRAVWWWFLNRVCRIMLDGRLSAAFVIAEGLGQGTLLSPVLFRVVVEFWMEVHDIVSTLLDVVTGYCDDICIFAVADSEAELKARLTRRGNEMLSLKFPLADWRIGILRSPELTRGRDREVEQFLRRFEVRLANGMTLRPPEVLSRTTDSETGGNVATAFRPAECVKFLGIPLSTSPAAWKVHFDGLEGAARAQENAIIATAKQRKLSTLEVVDKYHERCYNLLTYLSSVKSILYEPSLQRSDEIAEGSLRRLLAVAPSAPAYSTFLSAGAQIPSTAALAERATASVMAEAVDSEAFRNAARVETCFDFFEAGWKSLPVSLGLGPGVGLPDNVTILRDRDIFQLYSLPLGKANTPRVASLVREKMELMDRTLGPALLLVGTDSGDAEQEQFMQHENGAPPDRMATVVMRRGSDRPAAASVAVRFRHRCATFLGEAGGLGASLEFLADSLTDLDAALNDPRLKVVIFQVDNSPVLANLRSNRPEDLWRGLRVLLRQVALHRPDISFVLHWVPGHAGISPHSEADILQKQHLPDLPLRDFCPQLSVPLRLVRDHIRKNLRLTVSKAVEERGMGSSSGCMRGILASRFGSLRGWLKGLDPAQQEIAWSILCGDGRAAAKILGASVGADYVRCGLCGLHIRSCVVHKRGQEAVPIDGRVDLAHDDRPFADVQAAADLMVEAAAGQDGIVEEEPSAEAELTSDSEIPDAPAHGGPPPAEAEHEAPPPEVDGAGMKRHILLTGFARHLLADECAPVAEKRLQLSGGAAGSLVENLKNPKWVLRAVLESAGRPAPENWPSASEPRPPRDDPPPSHETMHSVKISAQVCAQNIEAFRTRAPPPSATQEAAPVAGAGRLLPASIHTRISAAPDLTQPPDNSVGLRLVAEFLKHNLDPVPRRPAPGPQAPPPAAAAAAVPLPAAAGSVASVVPPAGPPVVRSLPAAPGGPGDLGVASAKNAFYDMDDVANDERFLLPLDASMGDHALGNWRELRAGEEVFAHAAADEALDGALGSRVPPVAPAPGPGLVDEEDDLLADLSDDDQFARPRRAIPFFPASPQVGAAAVELLAAQENFVEDLDPVTGLPVAEGEFGLDPVADAEGPAPMEIDNEGVNHMEGAEADGLAAWENRRRAEQRGPEEPDLM
eukprot:g15100.t1